MWPPRRRVFDVDAEHGFLPLVAGDGGVADRIRAAGRRCTDRGGAVLPDALRADSPVDRRSRDLVRAPGLQPADHQRARGSAARGKLCRSGARNPHAAEPGLCGTDAGKLVAPKEESASQEKGRRQTRRSRWRARAGRRPAPAGAGPGQRVSVELPLAAASTGPIARDR